MSDRSRIVLHDDAGRRVASAEIDEMGPTVARASLQMEAGHHEPDARARLVDAVLEALATRTDRRLHVALPLGDHQLLAEVRERCPSCDTRVAGSTCLADVHLPDSRP